MRGSMMNYLPSVFLGLLVLGISSQAAAQDAPAVELSGGYNYLKGTIPPHNDSVSFAAGWYADVAITVPQPKKMMAVVLQVGASPKTHEGSEANLRLFMAGIRLNKRMQRTVLFVHTLFGNTNSKFGNVTPTARSAGFDEWTGFFTEQYGGGVNVMASEKVGLHLGADYLRVHGKHDSTILNEGFNMVRIVAGIVLPFGTR